MSKLINIKSKKNDPVRDWELNDLAKRKRVQTRSKVIFCDETQTVEKIKQTSKPKTFTNQRDKLRQAEIAAIKTKLHLIVTGKLSIIELEQDLIRRRQTELINIKEILKTETNKRRLIF